MHDSQDNFEHGHREKKDDRQFDEAQAQNYRKRKMWKISIVTKIIRKN